MLEGFISRNVLFRYALLGSAIAFAGPPIYIHVPKFYSEVHALDIALIGGILFAVRFVDFVQDPLLGYLIDRHWRSRGWFAVIFAVLLGVGVMMLFSPTLIGGVAIHLILASVVVFTGFSGLQILFYSTGIGLARRRNGDHAYVSGWREAGILIGVCLASVAPTLIGGDTANSYFNYALMFVAFLTIASYLAKGVWPYGELSQREPIRYRALFHDGRLKRIFVIGLLNTLPVGVTSTLFLFYVSDRLEAPAAAGVLLLIFFLCAGVSAPLWARLSTQFGVRHTLLAGMGLSVAVFAFVLPLGAGDAAVFGIVSALSGAAIGADLTLMPAMLSSRIERLGAGPARTFGIWGFLTKASLAVAAGLTLPLLSFFQYAPGAENDVVALAALSFAYAGIPCVLKVCALVLLAASPQIDGANE